MSYYGWDLIDGEHGHVTLKNALHNLSSKENGDEHEYSKGVLVGVMSAFVSAGMTFEDAAKMVWQHLPNDVHPKRIPESWSALFVK